MKKGFLAEIRPKTIDGGLKLYADLVLGDFPEIVILVISIYDVFIHPAVYYGIYGPYSMVHTVAYLV